MRVGVKALLSGVVPKNLIMLIGFFDTNQTVFESPALFASKEVLPQPPSP